MYSITLIIQIPTLEDRLRDIFEPYYQELDNDMYEEYLITNYYQPQPQPTSRWYSRREKKLFRRVDNKRHKKSRYSYYKARV